MRALAHMPHSRSWCSLMLLLAVGSGIVRGDTAEAPCTSSLAGDVGLSSCYGWCEAAQAADHCKWCMCSGCSWCTASRGGPGAGQLAGVSVAAGAAEVSTGVCSSEFSDDVAYRDCQDFCAAESYETHCALCKCKACSFCSCSSEFADDSDEQQCQSWCSAEFYDDHCKRCKCKGCGFCKA